MNKHREALNEIYSLALNYSEEKCKHLLNERYELLDELIEKTEPNINREIALLYFLDELIPNCIIFGGIKLGYIIVDNYKKRVSLGSVISCPYTHKVIRQKDGNFVTPLEVIDYFFEKGWVDDE